MLNAAAKLPDDYEYAIVFWGQSNAALNGARTDAWAVLPGLAEQMNGMSMTISAPGAEAVKDATTTVATAATVTALFWYAAEMRLGTTTSPTTGYGVVQSHTTTAAGFNVAGVDTVNDQIVTMSNHNLETGEPFVFSLGTGVTLPSYNPGGGPTPFVAGTTYFAEKVNATTFKVRLTAGGAAVDIASTGTGGGAGPDFRATHTDFSVKWSANADTGATSAYLYFRDHRHDTFQGIRMLTPYVPEEPVGYPTGSPVMCGYTPSVASYEHLAAFLPMSYQEGIDGYGATEDGNLAVGADETYLSTTSGYTEGLFAGGYLVVKHAGGWSWANITTNSNTPGAYRFVLSVWLGAGLPTGTPSAWLWQAWLPHYNNSPYELLPGPGFRHPNAFPLPYGSTPLRVRPLGNTALQYPDNVFGVLQGFAWLLSQKLGKKIHVVYMSSGGSTLTENRVIAQGLVSDWGWLKPGTANDWTLDGKNNLATRLKDMVVTMAPAALVAEGNTKPLRYLAVIGFHGESDAAIEASRNNYQDMLTRFYRWLGDLIYDAGLSYYGDKWKLPLIHAQINPYWESVSDPTGVVNAAIDLITTRIPFCATIDTANGGATALTGGHFDGAGSARVAITTADAVREVVDLAASSEDDWNDPQLVSLCNFALSHIGETAAITSLDPSVDASVQAAKCRLFYPEVRKMLLQRYSWSFALRRAELEPVTGVRAVEWSYAYLVPENAVRMISVLPPGTADDYSGAYPAVVDGSLLRSVDGTWSTQASAGYSPHPFTMEQDEDGFPVILSNVENAVARYNVLVADVRLFSPQFRNALTWQLAAALAGALIKGPEGAAMALRFLQAAEAYLGEAKTQDAVQREIKPAHNVSWLTARRGGYA